MLTGTSKLVLEKAGGLFSYIKTRHLEIPDKLMPGSPMYVFQTPESRLYQVSFYMGDPKDAHFSIKSDQSDDIEGLKQAFLDLLLHGQSLIVDYRIDDRSLTLIWEAIYG